MLRIGGIIAMFTVGVFVHSAHSMESKQGEAQAQTAARIDFMRLWDFQDLAETEKKFREVLPAAQQDSDKGYHAELLTQIARTEGLQHKFSDAHKTLDEAKALLTDETQKASVRYLLERGRVFNSSGELNKAKPLFLQAWDEAREAGEDLLAVDAAHMMAIVEGADLEESLRWNAIAIKFIEESEDQRTKGWLASLYNNTGWAYHDKGDYEKALVLFKKALVWHEKHGSEHTVHVAKWTIARCLRSLGKNEEALAQQLELEAALTKNGKTDGFVFEELAENYLALEKKEEAKKYFASAYQELSKDDWFKANEKERLIRLKLLGE